MKCKIAGYVAKSFKNGNDVKMAKDLDRSLATTEQLIVAGAEFVD